jgi:hypothetical protein
MKLNLEISERKRIELSSESSSRRLSRNNDSKRLSRVLHLYLIARFIGQLKVNNGSGRLAGARSLKWIRRRDEKLGLNGRS